MLTANALCCDRVLPPWIGSPRRCGESIRPSAAIASRIAAPGTCTISSRRSTRCWTGWKQSEPPRVRRRLRRRRTNASGSRGNCTTRSVRSLTVALLMLKRAVDRSPVEIRGELADTQEAVRAGLDEVRSIARRLRPDALEDLGLHSALNALCSEFAQASGIVVVKHIATQSDRLGSDVELVCYRIAQESLTNVARHARASKVWLDLHVTADQLTLRIADDGCGGVVGEGAGHQRHARTCAAGERRR